MTELLNQLGVNWKLLLSQGVNFFIVITTLTFLVYKPLLRLMHDRTRRIKEGLENANTIDQKLQEIEDAKKQRLAEADREALERVSAAEGQARLHSARLLKEANEKANAIVKEADHTNERKREEALEKLSQEAKDIIRIAIAKTVELDPKSIDEKLIKQAVETTKGRHHEI
ncbi:hypothetical protein HY967_00515 [Candidatus Jorgensenbacteria bacterium]|nr:hypothetical protein [Candidatus Jorgensenbacteria bacterium]